MHLVIATEATYRHFVQYLKGKCRMKRFFLILLLCTATASAQQNTGGLKGRVSDEFGGVIVGATVTATDANGKTKSATTNGEGAFNLAGLAPGKYTVRASAPGFGAFENTEVDVTARAGQLDVILKVTIDQQKVTVSADTVGVNTDPENNVGALVLRGTDLDSLPDDPDDLAAGFRHFLDLPDRSVNIGRVGLGH